MSTWFLVVGLVAVFAGLVLGVSSAATIGRHRSQIAFALDSIESFGHIPQDMLAHVEPPFGRRVVSPIRSGLAGAARKVTPADWVSRSRRRLDLAGNPKQWDPERLLAAKSAAALVLGGGCALLLLMGGRSGKALLLGAGIGVLGFFLPDILLKNTAQKRSQRIRKDLPDAVDLLSISIESGLAFDGALAQVAANTIGPLTQEFTRVLQEMQIGMSRSQALRAFADRTDVDELHTFLGSMVQAEGLGIPIVDVLRVQANEMRLKRSQRAEEQAMKLPVKIIFPIMLGIMPAIFIVILGPAVLKIITELGAH